MATTDNEALEAARKIVTEERHIIWAVARLRREIGLGLREAKALIVQALDELKGTYYLVTPGAPLIIGPYKGLETAQKACELHGFAQAVLVVGGYSGDGVHEATERFIQALPDPRDEELVHRLLGFLLKAKPELHQLLDWVYDRQRLIDQTRENITRGATATS